MARFTFGAGSGDLVTQAASSNSGVIKAAANLNATGTFWSAQTGGTQYTDLIDPNNAGVAITGVSTDANGRPKVFQGPDGVSEGWLDFGAGRFKVVATETLDTVATALVNSGASSTRGALDATYPRKDSAPKSLAEFGVLPGNTAAQNRTGFTNAAASGYTDFILPPGTYQYAFTAEGQWMMSFSGTSKIRVRSLGAVINDTTSIYTNNGALTGLFLLDNCKDFEVSGIEYVGPVLANPGTDLGYTGATLVSAINGTSGVKVDIRASNCRYGVSSGNYTVASQGQCKNFDIKLRGTMIGYTTALYYADGVRLDIDVDGVHRAMYLAGVNDATGVVRYRNQYIAPIAALLTDCLTGGTDAAANVAPPANPTTSRGCSNIDITVMETGSTTFVANSYVAGISLSRVDACVFRNIRVRVFVTSTASLATTVHGFIISSTAKSVQTRYPFNWESYVVLENIFVSGVDDKSGSNVSAGSSGSINIVTEDTTSHMATVRGLQVCDYAMQQPSSGGYVSSNIQARGATAPIVLSRVYHNGAWVAITGPTGVPTVLDACTLLTLDVALNTAHKVIRRSGTTIVATNPTTADIVQDGGALRGAGPVMRSKQVDATLSGASVTLTGAIPAGARVDSVQGRVSVAIGGASGFQVGVTGDLTRYGDVTATTVGSLMQPSNHAASAITSALYASATDLIVTAKTANFTAGTLRLLVNYWEYPALTS